MVSDMLFSKNTLAFLYVIVVFTTMYLCNDFLLSMKESAASQNRAAWRQVYWVRRWHLRAEQQWQKDWEDTHSVEYCRLKLQEAKP